MEVGETIEAAATREVKEETGLEIEEVRYVASQPWPFPSSLMIACVAHAHKEKIVLDDNELEDARWFTRDEVMRSLAGEEHPPFQASPGTTIARTLLEHWTKT